jgi:hypothetical protein
LLAGTALRIVEMLADLARPWPIAIVVDSVIGGRPLNDLAAIVLGSFSGSPVALLTAAVIASIVLNQNHADTRSGRGDKRRATMGP